MPLLGRYSTFDRRDLDEMNANTPTPSGSTHQIMDAIIRVRIDGKAVVRTRRTIDRGKPFYELQYRSPRATSLAAREPAVWH